MEPNDPIQPADTGDLAKFVAECDEFAHALQQQAVASQAGTALGGHPNPAYFNSRAASLLAGAAAKLRPMIPPPPAPSDDEPSDAPVKLPEPTTKSADQPAKKR